MASGLDMSSGRFGHAVASGCSVALGYEAEEWWLRTSCSQMSSYQKR